MKVEMFYTPGCSECITANAELRTAAQEVVKNLEWRGLNVFDDLDYPGELGVLSLPPPSLDGGGAFSSIPTVAPPRGAFMKRRRKRTGWTPKRLCALWSNM